MSSRTVGPPGAAFPGTVTTTVVATTARASVEVAVSRPGRRWRSGRVVTRRASGVLRERTSGLLPIFRPSAALIPAQEPGRGCVITHTLAETADVRPTTGGGNDERVHGRRRSDRDRGAGRARRRGGVPRRGSARPEGRRAQAERRSSERAAEVEQRHRRHQCGGRRQRRRLRLGGGPLGRGGRGGRAPG